jgi:hypothetical protein
MTRIVWGASRLPRVILGSPLILGSELLTRGRRVAEGACQKIDFSTEHEQETGYKLDGGHLGEQVQTLQLRQAAGNADVMVGVITNGWRLQVLVNCHTRVEGEAGLS